MSLGSPNGGDALRNYGNARVHGGSTTRLQGGYANHVFSPVILQSGFAVSNLGVGSASVHAGVTMLPAMTGAALVYGTVTTGLPSLPHLSVTGTTLPSGETVALQPVTVTFDGLLPNAPYYLSVGFLPAFVAALPMTLGEQLVHLPSAALVFGVLDNAGQFSFVFTPARLMPGFLGIPLFSQAGSLDVAAGQIRTSNCDVRVFGP